MIWLTWRQFRIQAWIGAAALVITTAALLAAAPGLSDAYHNSGYAGCTTDCASAADAFIAEAIHHFNGAIYTLGLALLYLLPALVGVFWGAPLVARELESGTYRLVWSQTVSRHRWLAVKLTGIGLFVIALAGLLSLGVTRWATHVDEASGDRIAPLLFGGRGVVPIGYAALAFVLGVLAGLVTRRVLVAMASTLLLVVLVQVGMPTVIRPLLASPVHATVPFDAKRIDSIGIGQDGSARIGLNAPYPGAWLLSNETVGPNGAEFTGPLDESSCGRLGGPQKCEALLSTLGLQQKVSYVPADKFWALQWRELGLLAGVTALLSLLCLWWVRRRLA